MGAKIHSHVMATGFAVVLLLLLVLLVCWAPPTLSATPTGSERSLPMSTDSVGSPTVCALGGLCDARSATAGAPGNLSMEPQRVSVQSLNDAPVYLDSNSQQGQAARQPSLSPSESSTMGPLPSHLPMSPHRRLLYQQEASRHTIAQEFYARQPLDHFAEFDDYVFWEQRYFMNANFRPSDARSGADVPVFLYVGGEQALTSAYIEPPMFIAQLAKRYGALLFALEHRYYGLSRPTADVSTENLRYLSVRQALADIASFRAHASVRHGLSRDARWVLFGCSYAGSLAVWFKRRYPRLAAGVVASSAPVRAKLDFSSYMTLVAGALGSECEARTARLFNTLERIAQDSGRWVELTKRLKTCGPFNGSWPLNVAKLVNSVAVHFQEVVQFHRPPCYRVYRERGCRGFSIGDACSLLGVTGSNHSNGRAAFVDQRSDDEVLASLYDLNDYVLELSRKPCLPADFQSSIDSLRDADYTTNARSYEERLWLYQTCRELGFFQTSSGGDPTFSRRFPIGFFMTQCREVFSEETPPSDKSFVTIAREDAVRLNRSLELFNAEVANAGAPLANVTFVNGEVDPWRDLSLLRNDRNAGVRSLLVAGVSHCADIYPVDEERDPPQLRIARALIESHVASWLG